MLRQPLHLAAAVEVEGEVEVEVDVEVAEYRWHMRPSAGGINGPAMLSRPTGENSTQGGPG